MANFSADLTAELNKEHLIQLEYLFAQSAKGIHLLFDNASIAKVLQKPTDEADFFNLKNIEKIQNILAEFIQKDSFADKEAYLQGLSLETYELLIRTYFNIVENTIFEASAFKH